MISDNGVEAVAPDNHSVEVKGKDGERGNLARNPALLLKNRRMSDVSFHLEGEEGSFREIPAHKHVLAGASAYFEKLFFSGEDGNLSKIYIDANEASVFEDFLEFVYKEKIREDMDGSHALKLFEVARRYEVEPLAKLCLKIAVHSLTAGSTLPMLKRGQELNDTELIEICLRVFDCYATEIIKKEEFCSLDHPTLCLLLRRDTLSVKEIDLYRAVLNWSESECQWEQVDVTPENQRQVLGGALGLIRFPTMKESEFLFAPTSVLSADEVKDIVTQFYLQRKGHVPVVLPRRFTRSLYILNRFLEVGSAPLCLQHINNGRVFSSSLNFQVNKLVFLHGLYLNCLYSNQASIKYTFHLELHSQREGQRNLKGDLGVVKQEVDAASGPADTPGYLRVAFENPVPLFPDLKYIMRASLKVQPVFMDPESPSPQVLRHYGKNGVDEVSADCHGTKVTFSFDENRFQHPAEQSALNGQIPVFIFSL